VGDQQAAVAAATGDLSNLVYTDASNYSYRTIDTIAKASGTSGTTLRDVRGGVTAGSPAPATTLYNQAYLTATGWQRCDDTVLLQGTVGSPSRTTFCGALSQVGFTTREDIGARSMVSVVGTMQADAATNTINSNGTSSDALLARLGTGTFTAASRLNTRYNVSLNQPIFINNIATDIRPSSESTLDQLIAARPASAVALANGGGTLSLGLSSGPARALRVAFTGTTNATTGTVQFYECDLDSTQTVLSNCATTQTGTYSISTVNGARVMRFAGHAPTTMTHTRGYAEVTNTPTLASATRVYQVRENKAEIAANSTMVRRLNGDAWIAIRAQLGI
jgi:hypothetical protein